MSENPSSWDLPLRRHVFLTLVGVILVAALFLLLTARAFAQRC